MNKPNYNKKGYELVKGNKVLNKEENDCPNS